MPIQNYSLLKGDPQSGKVVFNRAGKNPHYRISLKAGDDTFEVDINIQSDDGSEVKYLVNHAFTPPDPAALQALDMGMAALPSQPGGLALDFVRETIGGAPMVDENAMELLPISVPAGNPKNKLNNEVVDLLNTAVKDPDGTMYIFGQAFDDPNTNGIHDIHMNQGNPPHSHDQDNGIWQDGALFAELPAQNAWVAIFIAFQTQSFHTDDNGDVA
jgi:uncharacterized protein YukJ